MGLSLDGAFFLTVHIFLFLENFNTQSIVKWLSQEVSPKTVITDFLVLSTRFESGAGCEGNYLDSEPMLRKLIRIRRNRTLSM